MRSERRAGRLRQPPALERAGSMNWDNEVGSWWNPFTWFGVKAPGSSSSSPGRRSQASALNQAGDGYKRAKLLRDLNSRVMPYRAGYYETHPGTPKPTPAGALELAAVAEKIGEPEKAAWLKRVAQRLQKKEVHDLLGGYHDHRRLTEEERMERAGTEKIRW